MRRIYLDHNATTPVDPAVLSAMLPYLSAEFGNASSIHAFGQHAHAAVDRARGAVAALIGAQPSEIVFTSGGTESDNAAIFGVVGPLALRGRTGHVITSAIEHHAVLHSCRALEERGIQVTYVPASRDGVVDPEDVRRALRPDTLLITIMHANNELGTLQPVADIARIASEAGVRFHTDAVQSAGKVPLDVRTLGVDLLSLSGHKFGAPQGVGALFVKTGVQIEPLLHGGGNERGRRPGTENVAGIAGLGKAAELAATRLRGYRREHSSDAGANVAVDTAANANASEVGLLRDRLERELLARVSGARANGGGAIRTPNTTNIVFPGIDSEALVIALDLQGLACSGGAACSSGAVDPSHVLRAIGLSWAEARASIRLSLGYSTTADEISRAIELIALAVAQQRGVSAPRAAAIELRTRKSWLPDEPAGTIFGFDRGCHERRRR